MSSFPSRMARLALAAACLFPASSHAQEEATMVPVSLVSALLESYGRGAPLERFTVGALPPGFPTALVPASMKVVGGARQYGVPVVILRDSSARPLGTYQRLLESAGFIRPAPAPGRAFQTSGTPGDYYCRDSVIVTPTLARGTGDPRLLRVSYNVSDRRTDPRLRTCSATPSAVTSDDEPLTLPPLPPPPGAQSTRGGGGFGGDGADARTTLKDSTRTASEMARYYSGLLTTAGWTVTPPVADTRVGAASLSAKDSKGATWDGILIVYSRAAEHSVSITMKRTERR
jgi:hypothetical protein